MSNKCFLCGKIFETKITPSIIYNQIKGNKIFNTMTLKEIKNDKGISETKTVIDFSEEDWVRYHKILDKYISGLYYHHNPSNKTLHEYKYKMKHVKIANPTQQLKTTPISSWNIDNQKVFFYGYNFVPVTEQAIFLTVFYESVVFLTFIAEEEFINN